MRKICDYIETSLSLIAGLLFVSLFLVTVLNIVLRNIGGIAWLWIPGMTKLLFIWTIFLGTAVLFSRRDHLVMDYFVSRSSDINKKIIDIVSIVIVQIFLTILIIYGFMISAVRMDIPFETWKLPTGYAYLAAPVSAIFMTLFSINKIVIRLKGDI